MCEVHCYMLSSVKVRGEEHMEAPTMEQEAENERNKPHY
jgi:hypothetical protein